MKQVENMVLSWLPGDPQSAVGSLGDIVLFAQLAIARFKVPGCLFRSSQPIQYFPDLGYPETQE